MIEQGLVQFIQDGLGTLGLTPPGGFYVILPKDLIGDPTIPDAPAGTSAQAWCFHAIHASPHITIAGQSSWTELLLQIDCHGLTSEDAVSLARGIQSVLRGGLNGFSLPDPDATWVYVLTESEASGVDGYSDANRSYVRSLEYLVQYSQN